MIQKHLCCKALICPRSSPKRSLAGGPETATISLSTSGSKMKTAAPLLNPSPRPSPEVHAEVSSLCYSGKRTLCDEMNQCLSRRLL